MSTTQVSNAGMTVPVGIQTKTEFHRFDLKVVHRDFAMSDESPDKSIPEIDETRQIIASTLAVWKRVMTAFLTGDMDALGDKPFQSADEKVQASVQKVFIEPAEPRCTVFAFGNYHISLTVHSNTIPSDALALMNDLNSAVEMFQPYATPFPDNGAQQADTTPQPQTQTSDAQDPETTQGGAVWFNSKEDYPDGQAVKFTVGKIRCEGDPNSADVKVFKFFPVLGKTGKLGQWAIHAFTTYSDNDMRMPAIQNWVDNTNPEIGKEYHGKWEFMGQVYIDNDKQKVMPLELTAIQ